MLRCLSILLLGHVALGCGPSRAADDRFPQVAGQPRPTWSAPVTGAGHIQVADVAIGAAGQLAAVGSFSGTLALDASGAASTGASDGFAVQWDSDGQLAWLRRLDGPGADRITAVAFDGDELIIGGQSGGDAQLGDAKLPAGAFVAAIAGDGSASWTVPLPASEHAAIADLAIAADRIVAVGFFAGTVTVGDHPLTSAGAHDALVLALDRASGAVVWGRRGGGRGSDHAHAVAVGGGRFYVAGGFAFDADFGGATLRSNHNQDGFLTALTPAGGVQWVNTFGGTDRDVALALAANDSGVAVAGLFSGSDANFGTGRLDAGGSARAFVAHYAAAGDPRWAVRLGAGPAEARAVGYQGDQLIVAGTFSGDQRLGARDVSARGKRDLFAIALDGAGKPVWTVDFGGGGNDDLAALAATPRQLVLAGSFSARLPLPTGDLVSEGDSAGFVTRLTR